MIRSVISGTGSCIPEIRIANATLEARDFFETNGSRISKSNQEIIAKFSEITGIEERRYARQDQVASDLGWMAAQEAIENASVDRETLDYIIVAHNFGDVQYHTNRVNMVPSLASRIKALLKIQNPDCVAYDIAFGCPGWLEGLIQANFYILSGHAKRCLVVGTETLSRVIDPHDRDSMIYGDGAGAVVVEAGINGKGILSHKTQTYAMNHSQHLNMENSNPPFIDASANRYLKMNGRKVYEFALSHVPLVIKNALDKINIPITDIRKVLIHQANEKMDNAILERLFKMYHVDLIPADIMPMTIGHLGNSSVATIPTLLDLLMNGNLPDHRINAGDKILMASVGAGMNINALVYQL